MRHIIHRGRSGGRRSWDHPRRMCMNIRLASGQRYKVAVTANTLYWSVFVVLLRLMWQSYFLAYPRREPFFIFRIFDGMSRLARDIKTNNICSELWQGGCLAAGLSGGRNWPVRYVNRGKYKHVSRNHATNCQSWLRCPPSSSKTSLSIDIIESKQLHIWYIYQLNFFLT